MSDPLPQPNSTPNAKPTLEFELTYPNALDSATLSSAASFHKSHSPDNAASMNSKTWFAKFVPEVQTWTNWALVRALSEDTGEVRGQCVVVRWEGREEGKVLFVLELIGKEGGEEGTDVRGALLRQVREERMLMMDVRMVGCLEGGNEEVVRGVLGGEGARRMEGDVGEVLEGCPAAWVREDVGNVVMWEV